MNRSLIAAMVLLLGSATQALAAEGASLGCPTRGPSEATKLFRGRTHDFCEVKWRGLVAADGADGQTHDSYINVCARKCYASVGQQANLGNQVAGSQIGLIAGVGAAAAGIGVAAALGGGAPASP